MNLSTFLIALALFGLAFPHAPACLPTEDLLRIVEAQRRKQANWF